MTLDKNMFDVNEGEFDIDGINSILMVNTVLVHILPSFSPSKNKTNDCKHQKNKLGQYSCQTKPNKFYLILPPLDCQLNSFHHSSKCDRQQSRVDKSSAGSNHTPYKKHHDSCHLKFSICTRRYAAKMKKGRGVGNYVSPANSKLHLEYPLSMRWIFHEPPVQVS